MKHLKRWSCALLALCLAAGLCGSCFAETEEEIATADLTDEDIVSDSAELQAELQAVTVQVKDTLDIDDGYTDFSGSYSDGLAPGWDLYWSDDDRGLSVTCRTDGTVTDLYFWQSSQTSDRFYGFDAHFPALDAASARTQAEAWLARLMGEGETARIDSSRTPVSEDSNYQFSGCILIDGLESPITFSLYLDGDGTLSSYTRSDAYSGYVGQTPSSDAAVSRSGAADSLAETVALELYYITDAETGQARLTYVPVGAYTTVDAQTGEATDMDALYASFGGASGRGALYAAATADEAAESEADTGSGLTEVELSSIENYADALDESALDKALRAVTALGLDGFTLQRCSYSLDSGSGDITASLRYQTEMTADRLFGYSSDEYEDYASAGETLTVYKYISVNAKTGQLLSVSTSYPLWEQDGSVRLSETARRQAEQAFLSQAAGAMFDESALCTLSGYDTDSGATYARLQNGYFFPENYLYVKLNPAEGTVDEYSYVWDEDADFAAADGIVTEDEAKAAYESALTVTLGYVAWPESVERDDGLYQTYADWGYTYVESLRLAYYYSGTDDVSGVDALTGQALVETSDDGIYEYDDLDGVAEREQIETLAQAGIGFAGGSFRPQAALTQREAVTLLLQAMGYDTDSWSEDMLRSEAVYQGFVTQDAWTQDAELSELDFLRMILGPSRYGDTARLAALWDTEEQGFAAIAEALGMTDGEPSAEGTVTHARAAAVLYAFMSR